MPSRDNAVAEPASALYAADEAAEARPLRLGVRLDSVESLAWAERVLRGITQSELANIRLVILGKERLRPWRGLLARLWRRERDCALLSLYRAFDARVRRDPGTALRKRALRTALEEMDIVSWVSTDGELRPLLDPENVAAIREHDLDVLLSFELAGFGGELQGAARYGVWSFHYGPSDAGHPGPSLYWTLFEASPLQATIVEIEVEAPEGIQTISRSHTTTSESIWLSRHWEAAFGKTTLLLMRELRRLSRGGPATMPPGNGGRRPVSQTRTCPGNRDMMRFFFRRGRYLVQKKWQLFSKQTQWFLAYRTDVSKFIANDGEIDLSELTPIMPPKNHFYADPHVFERGEEVYVFFEDWSYLTGRGSVAFVLVDRDGTVGTPERALECEHHLSYPFVFEWEGEVYMIPEASETKALPLYRAKRFPFEWELEQQIMRGHEMVDPTLHFHEGKWFLFVNVRERPGVSLNDELFLFVADTPLGPWQPHCRNPIKSDVRSARPAGRLFRRGEKLIRPSQDCSTRYGSAINLCEVDVLSAEEYREHIVDRIEPTWWPALEGCHTLSVSDRVEVVDVRRSISRFGSVRSQSSLQLDLDLRD